MASAILFASVLAVISAITSGQKKAFEGAIVIHDYDLLESTWLGLKPAGDFWAAVTFEDIEEDLSDLGVVVSGKEVKIEIIPSITEWRVILELSHFIPAPQS